MSTDTGYKQFLRKYRLLVTQTVKETLTKTVKKTVLVTPEVPATPEITTWTGKVKTKGGRLHMRAGPGTKYKSLGLLNNGTSIEIVSKTGSWYQVKNSKGDNGIVYMAGQYIKVTGTKTVAGSAAKAAVYKEVEETVTETVTVEDNALDISNLRIVFICEKSTTDTPNYSVISIYNMSQKSISSIKAGDKVVLEAGYEGGNYGMIFTGQIVQPLLSRESAVDIVLNLIVQDGDVYLTSSFTAQTLSKSATPADVIRVCTNNPAMGISAGMISGKLSKARLPRGKVLFGKSADYLRRVAAGNKSQFYIEDGKVNIVAATDYASNVAVELNPMTGLIGMPEQTDDGVKGQCLINPSIKLNTLIYINSKLVLQKQVEEGETKYASLNTDGVYRIVKLTYEGDTHGENWYCTFEAVTQAGTKPTGMSGGESNPWR